MVNFSDPILWAVVAIIIVGFVFLIWAVGRFRTKKEDAGDDFLDEPLAPEETKLPAFELETTPQEKPERKFESPFSTTPPAPAAAPLPTSVLTSTFSKEVSDRLESMTQRLSEMQSVLSKQSASPAAAATAAAPGAIGQGLSPETIDKLLKIIGNVVGQVDVLQKSLNLSKDAAGTPLSTAPKPMPANAPFVTAPTPSTPPRTDPFPKP